MADGFLERSFEEYKNKKNSLYKVGEKSLISLLKKNRSYRGYDKRYEVSLEILEKIVAVNELIPSAKNQQALRFLLVTKDSGASFVLDNIKLGGMLAELNLPFKGTEPEAFIIVCSTLPESKMLHIDIGISIQSMLLRAVELGYNGIVIGAFNAKNIQEKFNLDLQPAMIVAIGKGSEKIMLKSISIEDEKSYYRENDIHIVPKISWKELIIHSPNI